MNNIIHVSGKARLMANTELALADLGTLRGVHSSREEAKVAIRHSSWRYWKNTCCNWKNAGIAAQFKR